METSKITSDNAYNAYIALGMYKQRAPMEMMRVAFPMMDEERNALSQNGPWTARTVSLERYAAVDTYA